MIILVSLVGIFASRKLHESCEQHYSDVQARINAADKARYFAEKNGRNPLA